MRTVFACLVILGAGVTAVSAAITVTGGDHVLAADTPNQTIQIMVATDSSEKVTGVALWVQIGANVDPQAGHYGNITNVDLVLFAGLGWQLRVDCDEIGYPAVFYADLFVDNFVNDPVADGVLATVMVDTTGMIPGAYDLVIDSTIEGASALYSSGTPHIGGTFVNGTITITPEPATLFVLALGGLSIIRRHRPR